MKKKIVKKKRIYEAKKPKTKFEYALAYHKAGYWVLPLITSCEKTKTPFQWTPYQTKRPSEKEIIDWWTEHPDYNIGLICGSKSNLMVWDADEEEAEKYFETLEGFDKCPVANSRERGKHYYFRPPKGVFSHHHFDDPDFDIQTDGNFIVAPPSVRGGKKYWWRKGRALLTTKLPPLSKKAVEVVLEHCVKGKQSKKKKGDKDWYSESINGVTEGSRNYTATRLLGRWFNNPKYSPQQVEVILREWNNKNTPPLSDTELTSVFESIQSLHSKSVIPYQHGEKVLCVPREMYHNTDIGNAERLIDQYGNDLLFCDSWKKWLTWDKKRWKTDQQLKVISIAKKVVKGIYKEAYLIIDDDERKKLAAHAVKSENTARLDAMVKVARSERGVPIVPENLDADNWLITCKNLTLDLRIIVPKEERIWSASPSGMYNVIKSNAVVTSNYNIEVMEHAREHLITKVVPVDYDPKAKCPMWLSFLDHIMNGNKDLIEYLQRAVGYSLTGEIVEQCFFILYGSGNNGKTTFLDTISSLLGDYADQVPIDSFLKKWGNAIPNDIAKLKGARFVQSVEPEEGQKLRESLMKQLTGGDTFTARFLHQEFFNFKPTFKIFIATNNRIKITKQDNAIWRRVREIPFTVKISKEDRDKYLIDKLKKELSGILNWAIEGCVKWQNEESLRTPPEVLNATADYKEEMDIIGAFIKEECAIDQLKYNVSKGTLYKEYQVWCGVSNSEEMTKKEFGINIKNRGFREKLTDNRRYWVGITMTRYAARQK